MSHSKIPVGICSCLMGENVRFNGGHTRSRFCVDHLSRVFEFSAFCPEIAIGLGTPREAIRMVGSADAPRVVGTVDETADHTDALYEYGRQVGRASESLCGYVLMKKSPSCSLSSAKIYKGTQSIPGKHAGVFTRGLMDANPLLPVEEDGRLNDPGLRENFIARVYAFHDWKQSVGDEPTPRKIVEFHSRYKYMLMAHSLAHYKSLGRFVANVGEGDIEDISRIYVKEFMEGLSQSASRKDHTNTLYHMLGYLRDAVEGSVRQELVKEIENYRLGSVNLSVPVALLRHYLKLYGSEYIKQQAYLEPHSYDLGLRNAI